MVHGLDRGLKASLPELTRLFVPSLFRARV